MKPLHTATILVGSTSGIFGFFCGRFLPPWFGILIELVLSVIADWGRHRTVRRRNDFERWTALARSVVIAYAGGWLIGNAFSD